MHKTNVISAKTGNKREKELLYFTLVNKCSNNFVASTIKS